MAEMIVNPGAIEALNEQIGNLSIVKKLTGSKKSNFTSGGQTNVTLSSIGITIPSGYQVISAYADHENNGGLYYQLPYSFWYGRNEFVFKPTYTWGDLTVYYTVFVIKSSYVS